MRILKVTDHYPPAVGGLAMQAKRIAGGLLERGHEVEVVAADLTTSTSDEDGVRVIRQRPTLARLPHLYQQGSPPFHPPWPDPEFTRTLHLVVHEYRPDIIHVHGGWSIFSAAALGDARPPIVCTLHDYGLVCPKKSLTRHGDVCDTGRGLRRCFTCDSAAQATPRRVALAGALALTVRWVEDKVFRWIAVSPYVAQRHSSYGLDGRRIVVIPPVIDFGAWRSGPPPEPSRNILYVGPGTEGPEKGRHVLIEAFRRLDNASVTLVLVGGRDGRVHDSRIDDRGYLGGVDLEDAYRGALFSVVPSLWPDPCPAVVVEAMSFGHPVIASAIGGLLGLVEDGRTGLHVPPNDPAALAGALAKLLEQDGLRRELGQHAIETVSQFRSAVVLPQLERLYEEAVRGSA
jgi:glycosyltransferase involved in cell wall biosynthesis